MKSKKKDFNTKRVSIRFTVGGLFVIATLLTAAIAIGFQFYFSKQIATENALTTYSSMSKTVSRYIQNIDQDAISTTRLLAQMGSSSVFKGEKSEEDIRLILAEAMKSNPHFYSLYFASENDDFYQLINLESSSIVREKIEATHRDRWVLIKIFNDGDKRVRHDYFYLEDFKLRYKKESQSNYYPTQRPWFSSAGEGHAYKSAPYLFQHLKITGQTYSIKIPQRNKVLGVDIVLSSISYAMLNSSLGKASETQQEAFIYKRTGDIIASNQGLAQYSPLLNIEPLTLTDNEKNTVEKSRSLKVSNQLSWGPIDFTVAGKPQGYAIDLMNIISEKTGLQFEYINGFSWSNLVERYHDGSLDILHSVLKTKEREATQQVSVPLYELPFAIVTKESVNNIKNIDELKDKKIAMLEGWSIIPMLKKQFPQIDIVTYPTVKELLYAVNIGKVFAAIEPSLIIQHAIKQYFIEGLKIHQGIEGFDGEYSPVFHLMMKQEDTEIVNIINRAIESITLEQRKRLENKWYNIDEISVSNNDTVVPYLALFELAHASTLQNKLVKREVNGKEKYFFVSQLNNNEFFAVVIPSKLIYSKVTEKIYLSIIITMVLMGGLLPLAWKFGAPIVNPIRQLEEETIKIKNRKYDEVKQVDSRIKEVWELSASIASMAQDLKQHEKTQEEFVEAFIQLIAQAIDDKSPYTAGHCNRVPELAMMLANAAHESELDGIKSFKFLNNDERREFRIAAWLHDCGKITTPEHIVDKGSKLETNYNRIHEIRMRFEVLWRDADISYYKLMAEEPNNQERWGIERDEIQKKLKDDFNFVAIANVGGEFMSEEHQKRIRDIANIQWDRYFDNTLGLSPIEELKLNNITQEYPMKESLLSDKPEHIIKRERDFVIDSKFGIKMDVPEHQYNLGEIYNLCISRGTLTNEDRFKINEHMISTIKMLDSLPFPPELQRVPRYASTHHETLKGTGYPRKLSADDLSLPERILVLSDIFEALTAADRPYKKAKPISLSLKIMRNMALDEHIDKNVFNLFLQSKTYLTYAKEYLKSEQIDEVDIAALMID
ncbi:HD domain-containing phosphohydrolase [Aliivibrio wodanis]|uniref:HD domain-containing phosphohydrolase n=1 Tax=Aliivibrio wodanis TaxID=80852 RepID=UPI00406C2F3F